MFQMNQKMQNADVTVSALAEGIFRIRMRRDKRQRESMLTRYGIIRTDLGDVEAKQEENGLRVGSSVLHIKDEQFVFATDKYELTLDVSEVLDGKYEYEGFCLKVGLSEQDRLYGLGDESREVLNKRGRITQLWQTNNTGYGPIPYIMSSAGWSLMMNVTYRHTYDMGHTKEDELKITSDKGMLDVYVFLGNSMKDALKKYTAVSGRPVLLPKAAYGLTFVNNEEEGARDLLQNCLMFRRDKIPCDIMGLEPGWMSRHYDFSLDKKWDQGRFFQCDWHPDNYSGSWSMFYNLRKMGFKLSLWLCCDYDLLWKEEKETFTVNKNSNEGAAIDDAHLVEPMFMDKITRAGEDWFTHLQKFVDQGASAFKLDGANQVLEHPDRLYAGKYTDDEVHNIYCVIYGKQMKEGFQKYTGGRRAMIYTPSLYAGQQQYCATWTGDTGGGHKTMICIMNLAMCGHANASCDMDVTQLSSIHYCALMPWMQHLGWRNWQHPWFLGDELEGIYRDYTQLRSALFPYIYSTAHEAARSGLPIVRPLSLAFEGEANYDDVLNEYMFGDSLLVAAFDMNVTLPSGGWTDFFTGQTYEGGTQFVYDPPKGKGGALMVKDGSIVVLQPWMPHLTHHDPTEYIVHVYPGADASFTLYEDDGETYAYEEGQVATTELALKDNVFTVGQRQGTFQSWSYDEVEENSVVEEKKIILGDMPGVVPFEVHIHNVKEDTKVFLDGEAVEIKWEDGCLVFRVPVSLHKEKELKYVFE